MAIVKMSKLRVIDLLKEKSKIYDILQTECNVHLKATEEIDNTLNLNCEDEILKLVERKNILDDVILFLDNNQNDEKFSCSLCELKSIENQTTNLNSLIDNIVNSRQELIKNQNDNIKFDNLIEDNKQNLKDFKLYSDWLSLKIERLKSDNLSRKTNSTFVMEFYTPSIEVEKVEEKLKKASSTIFVEKLKIEKDETPPTQTKNGKLISQAEFVTNMYSIPSYHELDPNFLVFWSFMIFFGYIMADMGIGLALTAICSILAHRIKENNGSKKLWTLISTGGIFTIIWGFLYNSFFGFSILPFTVMPDPKQDAILTLLLCLGLGIIHISLAYFMKGLNAIKNKRVLDAIFDSFLWDTFFIGATMALSGFLLEFFNIMSLSQKTPLSIFLSRIQFPGLIIMLVSLGLIIIFAGRKTKGIIGKFIKGFTSLYGIINLFSDILSYARLFGLMLSGAIIGQQFDQIGLSLMAGGSIIGYIFGFVVILIGNAFNIAMGALSAYIHDCRLQYIEYFGKFYSGEGILFKPFTPNLKYVNISQTEN